MLAYFLYRVMLAYRHAECAQVLKGKCVWNYISGFQLRGTNPA